MPDHDDRFQTRRFEQLANTIFGVAMTLLAYDFPKDKLGTATPEFSSILKIYAPHLTALLLSFIVAGLFWVSHQRRIAYAPDAGRVTVLIDLLFLLSIILLPVTSGLFGAYPTSPDVIALYGFHLFAISLLNLALWWIAVAPRRDWHVLVRSAVAATIFFVAAVVGLLAPDRAKYVWPIAFIPPLFASLGERWTRRKAA